ERPAPLVDPSVTRGKGNLLCLSRHLMLRQGNANEFKIAERNMRKPQVFLNASDGRLVVHDPLKLVRPHFAADMHKALRFLESFDFEFEATILVKLENVLGHFAPRSHQLIRCKYPHL